MHVAKQEVRGMERAMVGIGQEFVGQHADENGKWLGLARQVEAAQGALTSDHRYGRYDEMRKSSANQRTPRARAPVPGERAPRKERLEAPESRIEGDDDE